MAPLPWSKLYNFYDYAVMSRSLISKPEILPNVYFMNPKRDKAKRIAWLMQPYKPLGRLA